MSKHNDWAKIAPQLIYEAYPDQDVLPIEPPASGETISHFTYLAEEAGDTLFLFLCREADDEIDANVYLGRLNRAMGDIDAVRRAVHDHLYPRTPGQPDTIRIPLGDDWIELSIVRNKSQGHTIGSISSSLHSPDAEDGRFNTAVDVIESMILAHACAGVDVMDHKYIKGIRTCLESCDNNL